VSLPNLFSLPSRVVINGNLGLLSVISNLGTLISALSIAATCHGS
jgi:hypothetical protein